MADEKDLQSVRFVDASGGLLRSTRNPGITCEIPEGALQLQMNFIPVSTQVINIDKSLVDDYLGKGSAISPVIITEPVRRKFHKPLIHKIPVPTCGDSKVNVQSLRILFSLSGSSDNVNFEDITASIDLTADLKDDVVCFSSVCTGRMVLVNCANSIMDVAATVTDLYRRTTTDGYTNGIMPENKLFRAAKQGDLTLLVACMATSNVNINAQNQEGQTALHIACMEGHMNIVEELLSRGASCHIYTKRGNSPIHLACCYNHKDIVERLLDHGVDVNMHTKKGLPPIYPAIFETHYEIVQLLVSRHADSTWISPDGLSLILVAVFSTFNRDKMIAMVQLLKNSFDLDTQALGEQLRDKGFNNHGEALLHCVNLRTPRTVGYEVVEPVRQKLANFSSETLKEDLASLESVTGDAKECFDAVQDNDIDRFSAFVSRGFDINLTTEKSVTVLHLASMYGHYKIVGKILTLIGHSDISPVKKYLNQSLLVNKQTQGGFTALYLAAQEGNKDVVSMLLRSGASEKIVNSFGLKPYDIAAEMGHKEICTFLRDTKIPRRLFEDIVSAELNSSPAAGVKKRYSANTDSMSKKEKRKSTKSCSLS